MAKSLNRVQLIGNLTRDPELRYTPTGTAVCSFSVATNRSWTTDTGEKKDEVDFHRIVAWNKLAEICSQFLAKGRKVYVEGRLSTRNWTGQDGQQRTTTEIIINDMIILDSKKTTIAGGAEQAASAESSPSRLGRSEADSEVKEEKNSKKETKKETAPNPSTNSGQDAAVAGENISPDDIPF